MSQGVVHGLSIFSRVLQGAPSVAIVRNANPAQCKKIEREPSRLVQEMVLFVQACWSTTRRRFVEAAAHGAAGV
jgi:hypothetical protein